MRILTDAPMKPLVYCRRSIIAWQQDAKIQTRRLARPLPERDDWKLWQDSNGRWWWCERQGQMGFQLHPVRQPYAVDDLLWIREALKESTPAFDSSSVTLYQADSRLAPPWGNLRSWYWQRPKLPSIFMPRWACRYYARVVSVRAEPLRPITDEDAVAEGTLVGIKSPTTWYEGKSAGLYLDWWDELHKKPGTRSEDNPWVFVYGLEKADVSTE